MVFDDSRIQEILKLFDTFWYAEVTSQPPHRKRELEEMQPSDLMFIGWTKALEYARDHHLEVPTTDELSETAFNEWWDARMADKKNFKIVFRHLRPKPDPVADLAEAGWKAGLVYLNSLISEKEYHGV